MVNISKTKRNFIGLNTLFAILSGAAGALILHIALPGHYFGGYPFIPVYFYFFGLASIYMFDACRRDSAEIVTVVFGNEDDKDDSFADSGLDLLPCCTRRSQSFFTDVYLVLFDISDIRNLVFLLF